VNAGDITITLGGAVAGLGGFITTMALVLTVFWKTVGNIRGKLDLHDHRFEEVDVAIRKAEERVRELELGRSDSEVELGKMLVRIEHLLNAFSDVQRDVKKHLQAHSQEKRQ
jgi:hypothetical protein